jgi:hypothetical protein
MDGSVHTLVEIVKELGFTCRDCFEDYGVVFVLIGEEKLPNVIKVAPPL